MIALRGTLGSENGHIAAIGIDGRQVIGTLAGCRVIGICFQRRPAHGDVDISIEIDGAAFAIAGDIHAGRCPPGAGIVICLPHYMSIRAIAAMQFCCIDAPVFIGALVGQAILLRRVPDGQIAIDGDGGKFPFPGAHIQNGDAIGEAAPAIDRGNIHIPVDGQVGIGLHPDPIGYGISGITGFRADMDRAFSIISHIDNAGNAAVFLEAGGIGPIVHFNGRAILVGRGSILYLLHRGVGRSGNAGHAAKKGGYGSH